MTYIDELAGWWGTSFAKSMALPGYAPVSAYNVVNIAFWTTSGPVDAALAWSNLVTYFDTPNPLEHCRHAHPPEEVAR